MSDLAVEYRNIHATQPSYGAADVRLSEFVVPLIRSISAKSVIDYGCGKGSLGAAIANRTGLDVRLYDPYVPKFSEQPSGRFDLLVNTDVLEHVPECDLGGVLSNMYSLSDRCFLVISTRYAEQLLSDGSNAHCTVRPREWWASLLREHFSHLHEVDVGVPDTCAFVTWPISDATASEFRRVLRQEKWSRTLKRRRALFSSWLKERTGFFASLSELQEDVAGKSIAVVGNARSLIGAEFGPDIDAHDWVVRFNRAPIVHTRSHGQRTDWLVTGIPLSGNVKDRLGAKRTLWLNLNRKLMTKSLLRDPSTYMIPRDYCLNLSAMLGTPPSSGFVVLDILSKSDCANVDIYGFDFFQSKSLSSHLEMNETHHNFPSEKRLVKELCARDGRFKLR